MRAAIVQPSGETPKIGDVDLGERGVPVVAAALNPVDLAIGSGKMPFRQLPEGGVLGFEGVARRESGALVYFSAPEPPWGSYAEQVDLSGAETVSLPQGVDPVIAAAVGVPGIAAHLALTRGGVLSPGDRVLVLGGTGSVGSLAIQIALALGARSVVGTGRDAAGVAALERLGAVGVSSDSPEALDAALADPGGTPPSQFDVVIDTIWGGAAGVAMGHMATGGRFVQVGNAASATATITAPDFRNRAVRIVGHSNFLATAADRASSYAAVADLVSQGKITMTPRTASLDELPQEWDALAQGTNAGKVVITP